MDEWAFAEMKEATLPDPRQRGTLTELAARWAVQPEVSFSAAVGDDGRQAARRLFAELADEPDALLTGHRAQTRTRVAAYPWVLAVQDTTELRFLRQAPPAKPGLAPRSVVKHQYWAHSVLCLSPAGLPLGVLAVQLLTREPAGPADPTPATASQKREARRHQKTEEKESQKWLDGLAAVERHLPAGQPVVVIEDREGDVFDFLAEPRRPETHLLYRAAQPRKCHVPDPAPEGPRQGTLLDLAAQAPVYGKWTVTVPAHGRAEGPREREAVLTLRACALDIQPPGQRPVAERPAPQRVWVLHATEGDPPAGEAAMGWVLVTTLALDPEQPLEVRRETLIQWVRYYALRWRIERLHYTLKSGLKLEEARHAERRLPGLITLAYIVAWWLLWCVYWARLAPTAPAPTVLTEEEVAVLSRAVNRPVRTAPDVVESLARLVGYQPYRTAKPPGVKRLWQGLRRLSDLVTGYQLHRPGCESNGYHL